MTDYKATQNTNLLDINYEPVSVTSGETFTQLPDGNYISGGGSLVNESYIVNNPHWQKVSNNTVTLVEDGIMSTQVSKMWKAEVCFEATTEGALKVKESLHTFLLNNEILNNRTIKQ